MMHQYVVAITILNVFVANMLIGYVIWQLWDSGVAQEQRQCASSQSGAAACGEVVLNEPQAEAGEQELGDLASEEKVAPLESEDCLVSPEFAASAEVLKLRVDDYLRQLTTVEQRARTEDKTPDELLPDLCGFNQAWLSQLEEVCTSLLDNMDGTNEIESTLEEAVLNVAAQTETSCSNLANHEFSGEVATDQRFLLDEIYRLIRSAHDLCDLTAETLFKAGRHQNDSTPTNTARHLPYRKITEFVKQWCEETNRRMLSVAYLDVDRFTSVNKRHGTQVADRIADHLHNLIDEVLQDAVETATVIRLGGAKYIAFLEGADYSDAIHGLETTRQNTEAAIFKTATDELSVTFSAAVIVPRDYEPATVVLSRLQLLLAKAKPPGGNRVIKETASKPAIVETLKVFVAPRVISVTSSKI